MDATARQTVCAVCRQEACHPLSCHLPGVPPL